MANAQVLELLLPQLVIQPAKAYRSLEPADPYMLQETTELCSRLEGFCQRLNIRNNVEIRLNTYSGQLQTIADPQVSQTLLQLMQSDPWLPGAFRWLQPNYLMLAQSQELLAFSSVYQQSTTLAMAKFQHLALADSGMTCSLILEKGEISLVVESALHIYKISTISTIFHQ